MRILGIESSCDETAAAIVEDGQRVLSNQVFSQIEIHQPFQGVVPEIASRNHLLKIMEVVQDGMGGLTPGDIDAVAATEGPGLTGSLLVGLTFAKAIAYAWNKPLIPVNHIEAHAYAPHLTAEIPFPYIGLIVSGGHTLLIRANAHTDWEILGSTIDDAVGEAYDKVAKLMGLGYPGGPILDKLAHEGDPSALPLFRDMPRFLPDTPADRYRFSYSGLKTAMAYRLKQMEATPENLRHAAAAFQKSAVELLTRKTKNALEDTGIKTLTISGGVAANTGLRESLAALGAKGYTVVPAALKYCGDNAAMVAGRAYADYIAGKRGDMRTDAFSRLAFVKKGKRPPADAQGRRNS